MELSMWMSSISWLSASLMDLNRCVSILLNTSLARCFYLLFKYWELIFVIQNCTSLQKQTEEYRKNTESLERQKNTERIFPSFYLINDQANDQTHVDALVRNLKTAGNAEQNRNVLLHLSAAVLPQC